MSFLQCRNPTCSQLNKQYATSRGLSYHLNENSDCMAFMTMQCFKTTNSFGKSQEIYDAKLSFLTDQDLTNNRKTKKQFSEDYFESLKVYDEEYNNKFMTIFDKMNNVSKEFILPNEMYNISSEESSVNSVNAMTELNDSNHNQDASLFGHIFTQEQRSTIDLMKILEDMNCPDTALPQLLTWARKAHIHNITFDNTALSRKSNLNWMRKMVINPNNDFLPKTTSVPLNDNTLLDVVHFDFVSQLLCILQNKNLMTKRIYLLIFKIQVKCIIRVMVLFEKH